MLLRDGPSLKVEQPRPIDISPECAAMLEKLCLAQAQECTFEKARQDKKNPAILARRGANLLLLPPCDDTIHCNLRHKQCFHDLHGEGRDCSRILLNV